MNVARKFLERLKQVEEGLEDEFGKPTTLLSLIDDFEQWIEWHEKIFEHESLKLTLYDYVDIGDLTKEGEQLYERWLEFHDKIVKE
jgi:hypothetical protein